MRWRPFGWCSFRSSGSWCPWLGGVILRWSVRPVCETHKGTHRTMAMDQSALLGPLAELRNTDVGDRFRTATEHLHEELIDADATARPFVHAFGSLPHSGSSRALPSTRLATPHRVARPGLLVRSRILVFLHWFFRLRLTLSLRRSSPSLRVLR